MKNLYEILEVNKNASNEIIKVAYKSLVKKYHPDLKEGLEKINAEEKIKEINDAYDVLSDPIKRAEYDNNNLINDNKITAEQYNAVVSENIKLKNLLNKYINNNNYYNENNYYQNANYTNYTENNNMNNNHIKSFFYKLDSSVKNVIALLLTFFIIFIVFSISFIRDFFIGIFGSGYLIVIIAVIVFFYLFRKKE